MATRKKLKGQARNKAAAAYAAAADAAAARSPQPSTVVAVPPFRFCPHTHIAGGCNMCLFSIPQQGCCLHTLRQDERNFPTEIKKLYMPVFYRFMKSVDQRREDFYKMHWGFWERPENARYVNEKMVRLFLSMTVRMILLLERSHSGLQNRCRGHEA